ncbi:MAG: N-acetylmuramoyl-L-alanine amidase [Chlamydiales bacterium]
MKETRWIRCFQRLAIELTLLVLLGSLTGCASHRPFSSDTIFHEKPLPSLYKKEMIVIDAGHGGKDSGAMSQKDHYEEKKFTLETAHILNTYLNQLGYKTVMTRSQDTFLSLNSRAEIANSLGADIFISIHYNFATNKDAKGVEVYYLKEEKKLSSPRILKSKALGAMILNKVITKTNATSRGLKEANFLVIRETEMPAVLFEGGFLSNSHELEYLRDLKYQRLIARGIAQGIDQYLELNRKNLSLR